MVGETLLTGRDALHRLDDLTLQTRSEFEMAVQAADAQKARHTQLAQMQAEGYRELAQLRLDDLENGALEHLTTAEAQAVALLEQHQEFIAKLDAEADKAESELRAIEGRRRAAETRADTALQAYEAQVAKTEARLQEDPDYLSLEDDADEANAVTARATQKQELALADREQKGAPYESDALFTYLWARKFRTPEYKGGGLTKMLDNWVAKLCGYDAAYLKYARLTELPERLNEHVARMELEESEAEAAIEAYESAALKPDGADELAATVSTLRGELEEIDAELSSAEHHHSDLRERQQEAATGDVGPRAEARKLIEEGLQKASFPDLRVLASETVTLDDDRLVDALVRLRTEELQLEVSRSSVNELPGIRRASVDAMERARRKFKQAGLDNPYVGIARGAFEAAIEAYGRGPSPDGERLWRALAAAVRRAPTRDDHYFGGRKRRNTIGLPQGSGDVAGVVLREILRGNSGRSGGWGGGGPWSGGTRKTSFPRRSSGGSRSGGRRGGGFKTGGRF